MTVRDSDYFAHYGVKGMKWGVRKDSVKAVGQKAKRKVVSTKAYGKAKSEHEKYLANRSSSRIQTDTIRTKRAYQLTDEELKIAIGRMNLEKQYKTLNREVYHPGRAFANKALNQVGGIAIGAGGAYLVKKVVPKILKRG